ncbi:MAG TPA: hypothetical protein VNM16_12415, partial [Bacillota bacterium]|nr:hypothetical protein [Bacillota bacterium]
PAVLDAVGIPQAQAGQPVVEVAAGIDSVAGQAVLRVGRAELLLPIDAVPWPFQLRRLGGNVGLAGVARSVWRAFQALECLWVGVSALADGSGAVDGFADLDPSVLATNRLAAALVRDSGLVDQADLIRLGIDYVPLAGGDVGIVGVGAGETMAVVDLVARAGRRPTAFCDISKALTPEGIRRALRLVGGTPGVRCVLINIFGGITRVDWFGEQLVAALAAEPLAVPVVFRLEGNGAAEGRAAAAAAGHVVAPNLQAAIAEAAARAGG